MYYIVYRTTNLVNNKFYVGIHKQKNIEFDGYYGSGLLLIRAIEKYGIENFKRETLYECKSWQECRMIEKEIVNKDLCNDVMCYNISIGGTGGNTTCGYTDEQKKVISEKVKNTRLKNGGYGLSPERLVKAVENMRKIRIQPDNKGRVHTQKSKENIAAANHMNNARHFTNGTDNTIIYEGEPIPDGYFLGRTLTDDQKFKGHNDETLKNMSVKRMDSHYYNNGIINKLFFKDDIIPEGWVHGMLPRKEKAPKKWYTNGINTVCVDIDNIPDGYYLGRLYTRKSNTEIKKD